MLTLLASVVARNGTIRSKEPDLRGRRLALHFAASTITVGTPDWRGRLGEIREAGCRAVELWAAFGQSRRAGPTFDYADPHEVEKTGCALARADLPVHSMHGPIRLGPRSASSPFGEGGLDALLEAERAALDAMMALGGRFVVTQDAAELEPEGVPHLASAGALRELAEYAHAHGCVFCIENGAESPAAFERLVGVVRELAHPGLGICLDTGHAQVAAHHDVPRAIRECGTALRSCHVHDNLGHSDAHLGVGDGIIPWRAILEALAEVGYRGPVVLETWGGAEAGSAREVIARSRAVIKALDEDRSDFGELGRAALRASQPARQAGSKGGAGSRRRRRTVLAEAVAAGPGREPSGPPGSAGGFDARNGTIRSKESDLRVFRATAADRKRASLVLGPGSVGPDATTEAVIAVDRFGDPAAWAEVEREGGATRLRLECRKGAEGAARRIAELLSESETFGPGVRAEGAAAGALTELGYAADGSGVFTRGPTRGPTRGARATEGGAR